MMPVLAIALQAAQRSFPVGLVIQFVAIIAIFWFLLIRPQRKIAAQHKATLEALKKGDEVLTAGGIIGTVVHLTDDRVTIRTDKDTRIVILRPKIERVFTPETAITTTP